jgi:hypothetical protein
MNNRYLHSIIIVFVCWLIGSQALAQGNEITDAQLNIIIHNDKPFSIKVIGNGNIQSSIQDGGEIPANTGVGISISKYLYESSEVDSSTFYRHKPFLGLVYKVDLNASINVASTVDTMVANFSQSGISFNQSKFGTSILTPLNAGGGQAVDLDLSLYFKKTFGGLISGAKLRYIGSNRNWQIVDTGTTQTIQATNNMFRFGIYHDFVTAEKRKNYSVQIGVNYALNSLSGDIGLAKNNLLRNSILGTDSRSFQGIEFVMSFQLENLRVNFSYPWLHGKDEVSGLTGGRLVTNITFVGGFGLDVGKN